MPIHVKLALISLGICAVLGAVYAFAKWYQRITNERDLIEFHKEFVPLAAEAKAEKKKEQGMADNANFAQKPRREMNDE